MAKAKKQNKKKSNIHAVACKCQAILDKQTARCFKTNRINYNKTDTL